MSLFIHPGQITSVLLADGWHTIDKETKNRSLNYDYAFFLDSYEFGLEYYNWDDRKMDLIHGGGQSGICSQGFQFISNGQRYSGPLTSVIAVQHNRTPEPDKDPNWVAAQKKAKQGS